MTNGETQNEIELNSSINKILGVLDHIGDSTVTVFGDYCLDKYLYIDPVRDEISLETGLTAYQADRKSLFPGAAGTVVGNLRSLGARVRCVGLIGEDGEGYELTKALRRIGADTGLMVRSDSIMTNTYIKPMRGSGDTECTEMNRIDIRNFKETSEDLEDRLLENLKLSLGDSLGVVITDQFLERNCSVITDRVRCKLAEMARQYADKFFFADSRGFIRYYHDIIIKCNQFELPGAEKSGVGQDEGAVLDRGGRLLAANGRAVVITLGEKGAYVLERGMPPARIPAFPVEGPVDIVGAGDATSAGAILGLTLGLSLPEAVLLGGCVSSITIQQIGVTGTATVEQVRRRLLNQ